MTRRSLLLCVALPLTGCRKKQKSKPRPTPSPGPTPPPVALDAKDAVWTVRREGQRLLTLKTAQAQAAPEAKGALQGTLHGGAATVFREEKPVLELSGEVSADEEARSVTVRRGTAIRTDGSATLRADTIRWDRKSGRIEASGNVRLELSGAILTGTLLRTDDAFSQLTLRQ